MPGVQCPQCGSSNTEHYDNAVTCADCGCVLEESQIVSDITFGETGSGGAVVQGSYVANDSREWQQHVPGQQVVRERLAWQGCTALRTALLTDAPPTGGARTQGPGGFRSGGTGESRAMTIANGESRVHADMSR